MALLASCDWEIYDPSENDNSFLDILIKEFPVWFLSSMLLVPLESTIFFPFKIKFSAKVGLVSEDNPNVEGFPNAYCIVCNDQEKLVADMIEYMTCIQSHAQALTEEKCFYVID